MRKLLTFLFAALMSVGMWALTPQGEDTWDEGTKTLTVNSNPGHSAYYGQNEIQHVIINNTVTSIGQNAFYDCKGLTSVTIPNSLTSIGFAVFYGCTSLTSPVYNAHVFAYMPTSYSGTYTIPDGIESIAGYAFGECTGLTSITIPNSVTSIGNAAFLGCTGLTSITIPSNVKNIIQEAFYLCFGLKTVTILAESLDTYGPGAFDDTHANLKIYVPAGSVGTYKAGWAAYQDRIFAIGAFFDITANVDPDNAGVYYSTFYHSSKKYELPDGVEAFIVTAVSGDAMQLKQIAVAGQTIPAGAGVILKATSEEITLTLSEADAESAEGNKLLGVDDAITNPNYGRVYVLSAEDGAVGFYKLSSGATIPAHKAYVTIPSGGAGAPKRLRFVYDQATGIENGQMTNDERQTTKIMRDGQLIIIRNGVEYNANGQIVK